MAPSRSPRCCRLRIPQLLLNGSAGIAVGMATNIPPHNLNELIDGLARADREPRRSPIRELIQLIPGPDFPTGGQILGRAASARPTTTGRGSVTMRGVANIENDRGEGAPRSRCRDHHRVALSDQQSGADRAHR